MPPDSRDHLAFASGAVVICKHQSRPFLSSALRFRTDSPLVAAQADEIPGRVAKWAGVFVAIGVGSLLASLVQQGCFSLMGGKLARRVRMLSLTALMRQVALQPRILPAPHPLLFRPHRPVLRAGRLWDSARSGQPSALEERGPRSPRVSAKLNPPGSIVPYHVARI
jgi:hypothetical protein